MMDMELLENALKVKDFVHLREAVGSLEAPIDQLKKMQAKRALENGIYNVSAVCDGDVVGMGRLVGDGVIYWYIQDVAVLPEYQGRGIGKAIVNKLVEYAEENSLPDTRVTIGLFAAKDKDTFYEKLGFARRPNDNGGAGMTKRFIAKGHELHAAGSER